MAGEEFKNEQQKFIDDNDDQLYYHSHQSIQLHGDLPTLTTDAHLAKRRRKDTSKIKNGITLAHEMEESATCQIQGSSQSVWSEWLNSKSLKLIAVVGQSGVGKSNLAQKILRSQLITSSFQYRFFISLKGDCKKEMNLLEFLTQQKLNLAWVERPNFDNLSDCSTKAYQRMIKKLDNEKLCIIFDDIGIGSFSFNKDEEKPSCFNKHPAQHFFSCILNNELLGKAKIVMVLNHWEYEHVALQLQPKTWKLVHVFGIGLDDRTRMAEGTLCHIQTCCAYNATPKSTDILDVGSPSAFHDTDNCLLCKYSSFCDCSDEIQLFLNVPIHCQSLLEHSNSCKKCRIASASYLLLKWLEHIAKIYPTKNYCLIKVGKFAWEMYAQHTFLFAFDDLKRLSKVERNIFFISLRHILGNEKDLYYRFSNILLQDFLAAVWCLSLSDVELEENKEQFKKWDNYAIVIGFMDEICRTHQQFRFDPPLKVLQKNIEKIRNCFSNSNAQNNSNTQSVVELLRTGKREFLRLLKVY